MAKSARLKKLAMLYAVTMLSFDSYFVIANSRNAAVDIGWAYIAGAVLTQLFLLVVSLIVTANKDKLLHRAETSSPMDNLRKVSCAVVFLAAGLGFSTELLQVGIVCPQVGIFKTRGEPACRSASRDPDCRST